jgi:hypothetical protein
MKQAVVDIAKRVDTAHAAYALVIEALEYTGFDGREPFASERAKALMATMSGNKLGHAAGGNPESATVIFDLEYRLQHIGAAMGELEDIARRGMPDPSHMYSSSGSSAVLTPEYHRELAKLVGAASETRNLYMRQLGEMHLENYLLRSERYGSDYPKLLDKVQDRYLEYVEKGRGVEVIGLYTRLITAMLNQSEEMDRKIGEQLETIRTAVLSGMEETVVEGANRRNGIQLMVQTYGLLPDGPCRPLGVLLGKLLGRKDAVSCPASRDCLLDTCKLLCSSGPVGMMVLERQTLVPMEYILPNVGRRGNVGIDLDFADATTTIRVFESGAATCGKVRLITVPGRDPTHYFIIDVLGPTSYRLLRWQDQDRVPSGMVERMARPRLPPSRRVEHYNSILEDQIVKYVEKPLVEQPRLSRAETKRDAAYWGNLRQRIMDRVKRRGRETVSSIIRIIVEAIEVESAPNIDNPTILRLYKQELQTSYKAELAMLEERLESELRQGSLEDALKRVITPKSNIFKEIDHKSALLRGCLVPK